MNDTNTGRFYWVGFPSCSVSANFPSNLICKVYSLCCTLVYADRYYYSYNFATRRDEMYCGH